MIKLDYNIFSYSLTLIEKVFSIPRDHLTISKKCFHQIINHCLSFAMSKIFLCVKISSLKVYSNLNTGSLLHTLHASYHIWKFFSDFQKMMFEVPSRKSFNNIFRLHELLVIFEYTRSLTAKINGLT